MAHQSYQNINLFWMALAGTGLQTIHHQGGRGMDERLSHAYLSVFLPFKK